MPKMLSYNDKGTWIHNLCGVTKLVFFLLWTITAMICYDIRVLSVMVVISVIIFIVSKTSFSQVKGVFTFVLVFLCINLFFYLHLLMALSYMVQSMCFLQ